MMWFPALSVLVEQIKSSRSFFQKQAWNVKRPPPSLKGKTQGRCGLSPPVVTQEPELWLDSELVVCITTRHGKRNVKLSIINMGTPY